MPQRIRPADASLWADTLSDTEQMGQMSVGQIRTMQGQLTQYQEEQTARQTDLTEQGFTRGEVMKLMQAENAHIDDGSYETGGQLKRQGPVPGTTETFAVAHLLNAGKEGVLQAVEGLGDVVNEIAVGLNIADPETADKYKEIVRKNRVERKISDMEVFGKMTPKAMEMVGKIAPWVATGNVGGGYSLLRYGLTQGVVGATAAVAEVTNEPIQDRWNEALMGGGLGTAGTAVMGAPWAVRRWAFARFQKELNLETSLANTELEASIQGMLNQGNFSFSLSQVTGNRFLFALEQSAAGRAQKLQQNQNMQALFDNILDMSKKYRADGLDADQIAGKLNVTLKTANKSLHKRASSEFEANLNKIEEEYGSDIILDYDGAQNYLDKVNKHIETVNDPLRPGVGASPSFLKYREELDTLINPVIPVKRIVKAADGKTEITVWDLLNRRTGETLDKGMLDQGTAMSRSMYLNEGLGGLQAGEINRVTMGLNDMLAGRTQAVIANSADTSMDQDIAKGLMGTLTRQLSGSSKNPDAVKALELLRENYKGHMLVLGDIERLTVNRLFGQAEMPADPDQALDMVLAGGKTSLKNTREFLMDYDPALLADLQATFLKRIAQKGGDVTLPQVDVPLSLNKLATALGGAEGVGMKGVGLFDAATQADLVKTGQALRTINNMYFTGIKPSMNKLDDVAINVISRSPEFMARFVTRVFSGGESMSNMLLDPLLRKSVQRLAEGSIDTPTGRAAMVALAQFLNEQEDKAAKDKENLGRAERGRSGESNGKAMQIQ